MLSDKERKLVFQALNYIFFLFLGVLFFWLFFREHEIHGRKVSFGELINEVKDMDLRFFALVFAVSFFGNIVRMLRWRALMATLDHKPERAKTFMAMMIGYFVNFFVPRLGELSRCYALRRSTGVPLDHSFGTVLAERVVDFICLLIVGTLVVLLNNDFFGLFYDQCVSEPLGYYMDKINLSSPIVRIVLGALALGLILLFVYRKKLKANLNSEKSDNLVNEIFRGLTTVFKANKGQFLWYTLIIWVVYFLSTYIWLKGYPPTQNLGIKEGFLLLIVGSIARSLPIPGQGGAAYLFLVGCGVGLLGFQGETVGSVLAMIIYLTQTIFYLAVGGICSIIYMALYYKNIPEQVKVEDSTSPKE